MVYEDWTEMYEYHARAAGVDRGDDTRHELLSHQNQEEIDSYIGTGPRTVEGASCEWYYRDLIAWSAKHCLSEEGWKPLAVFGYSLRQPLHRNISTDVDIEESCLVSGQMAVERDGVRLIVTVDIRRTNPNHFVQVEGPAVNEQVVKQLILAIEEYLEAHNFYRGKNISMDRDGIEFVPAVHRTWDSVILDAALKRTIRHNTVGFLKNLERWPQYGIPTKRGIILTGGPGTGKTIICKALMTEAAGTTCLVSNADGMFDSRYFSDLYEIAQDLAPCIVFIEDLDSIGQEREGMYRGSPQLVSLLAEMDGISEKNQIVTVATTNHVETLDEALRKRPARFDRVVTIPPPSADLRAAHIDLLSGKIPLNTEVKEHLVARTEGLSPAQVQEAVFGLVINRADDEDTLPQGVFTKADVDTVIRELKDKADRTVGFNTVGR
jgi:cell division protease FtsH